MLIDTDKITYFRHDYRLKAAMSRVSNRFNLIFLNFRVTGTKRKR